MKKIDPVCKCPVNEAEPNRHLYFDGRLFYFCSDTCKHRFNRTPFDFIGYRRESEADAIYTVPLR